MSTTPVPHGHAFSPIRPVNPGELGFPPALPIELAMGECGVKEICAEYGLTKDAFAAIIHLPRFIAIYERTLEMLQEPGGMVQVKAMLLSEDSVKHLYDIISDKEAPAAARIEAIKVANAMAGVGQKNSAPVGVGGPSCVINIQFDAPMGMRGRVIEAER